MHRQYLSNMMLLSLLMLLLAKSRDFSTELLSVSLPDQALAIRILELCSRMLELLSW